MASVPVRVDGGGPSWTRHVATLLRKERLSVGPFADGKPVTNRVVEGLVLRCTAPTAVVASVDDGAAKLRTVEVGSYVVAAAALEMGPGLEAMVRIQPEGAVKLACFRADLNSFSIFEAVPAADRTAILRQAYQDPFAERAVGALLGMAVGDSVGAPLEFASVLDTGHRFDPDTLEVTGGINQFRVKPGQWTDDTSMGLCIADSLLACGEYDGTDIRLRFWNWWFRGYNNAFRYDDSLALSKYSVGEKCSVGCGANVKASLCAIVNQSPPPRFAAKGEDAGNGSLMRLAPIPIYFHASEELAVRASAESSLTTHPGAIAADACAFLGFLLRRAIVRDIASEDTAACFLDACVEAYLARPEAEAQPQVARLLCGAEPIGSPERCWSWRDPAGPFLRETVEARGDTYNGYQVKPEYFGSFCADGLAMALHCFYHTSSFMEAVSRSVNLLGDADTVGAICGQIAGAFYGVSAIDSRLVAQVQTWDGGEIALRGALLFLCGVERTDADNACTNEVLRAISTAGIR